MMGLLQHHNYIIALLMADLNNGKNTSLVIDGQSVSVVSDKSFSTSSVMCSSNTGLMIGLLFFGFVVGAIISGIIITVIAVLVYISASLYTILLGKINTHYWRHNCCTIHI